jgi:hypothetical protein
MGFGGRGWNAFFSGAPQIPLGDATRDALNPSKVGCDQILFESSL